MRDVNIEQYAKPSEVMIHLTQQVYRKLLDAMARPGRVHVLDFVQGPFACGALSAPAGLTPTVAAVALTLLDSEVSFALELGPSQEIEQYLHIHTLSRARVVEEADFVLARGSMSGEEEVFFKKLKKGTLVSPHQSATLILSVRGVDSAEKAGLTEKSAGMETGERYMKKESVHKGHEAYYLLRLQGPGIPDKRQLLVKGCSPEWITAREKYNDEFPLGVDLILAGDDGTLAALPRSIRIQEVASWVMSQ